jgi:hypothetical protein
MAQMTGARVSWRLPGEVSSGEDTAEENADADELEQGQVDEADTAWGLDSALDTEESRLKIPVGILLHREGTVGVLQVSYRLPGEVSTGEDSESMSSSCR